MNAANRISKMFECFVVVFPFYDKDKIPNDVELINISCSTCTIIKLKDIVREMQTKQQRFQ